MASISREPNGKKTIQFVAADKKRRSVRLGKCSMSDAKLVKTKIEALAAAAMMGNSPDAETATWVGSRDTAMYDKLAAVGLVAARVSTGANSGANRLGEFLDSYIAGRTDVKPWTRTHLQQARRKLVEVFGADRELNSIYLGDADNFRKVLRTKLGENTVRRLCGRAKQFFRAALRLRLIAENPFGDMKGCIVMANRERDFFVTREMAASVLAACPDAEWRLLFALSRFGGLRCPSEHLSLRWGDIDWERKRMVVRSPKTEHHEGKAFRIVPIFPELRTHLECAFNLAQPGIEFVIARYRDRGVNLRTRLERIIARAGLSAWPKLWHNLRATRQTELAQTYPIHVVCDWIGNSQAVATKHYLRVTDTDFERATNESVQNPVHQATAMGRMTSHAGNQETEMAANCGPIPLVAISRDTVQTYIVPPDGLEPSTL